MVCLMVLKISGLKTKFVFLYLEESEVMVSKIIARLSKGLQCLILSFIRVKNVEKLC